MRASCSASSTALRREAGSRSFAEAEPRLPPIQTVTLAEASSRRPHVVKPLAANRRCEKSSLSTETWASSALQQERSWSQTDLISFSERSIDQAFLAAVFRTLIWRKRVTGQP